MFWTGLVVGVAVGWVSAAIVLTILIARNNRY